MLGCVSPVPARAFLAEWVSSRTQKHALSALIIPRLVSVSVEIPFTCQPLNCASSFVLLFVIKTPIWGPASALTDRVRREGKEGVLASSENTRSKQSKK